MILITRNVNEGIRIGPDIVIKICQRPGTQQLSIGIQAPGGAHGMRIERIDAQQTAQLIHELNEEQPKGSCKPLPPITLAPLISPLSPSPANG